jgi:hypothetical protein
MNTRVRRQFHISSLVIAGAISEIQQHAIHLIVAAITLEGASTSHLLGLGFGFGLGDGAQTKVTPIPT